MRLSELLDGWVSIRILKPGTVRRFRYELNIWRRCGGPEAGERIDISAWQTAANRAGLRPRTVNSVASTVALLCRYGKVPCDSFSALPVRIDPKPTPTLNDLNRLITTAEPAAERSADWWKRWLSVAYCTGLRRADLLAFTVAQIIDGELAITAGKTGKRQVIPLPAGVISLLPSGGDITSSQRPLHVGVKQLLRTLREWSGRAGLAPAVTPQALRRLSAREWERAHAGCGAVILGHDIPGWSKATAAYIDRADLLRAGLPRLRLPAHLGSDTEREQEQRLTTAFRRLSKDQRGSVCDVVNAMVK